MLNEEKLAAHRVTARVFVKMAMGLNGLEKALKKCRNVLYFYEIVFIIFNIFNIDTYIFINIW